MPGGKSLAGSVRLSAAWQYENNRAEVSHQPIRQRERQMRRFASVHGVVQNLFLVGRHLLRAAHHRLLRARAFTEWEVVTCAR